MDAVDKKIVHALQQNSRLSMRKLATLVHMTAPAVAERVRHLEEEGIIIGYTIRLDGQKVRPTLLAYIDVLMTNHHHHSFLRFIEERREVRECHRIAGNACYLLKVEVPDQSTLNEFLEALLVYANYRLHLVVASTIKDASVIV